MHSTNVTDTDPFMRAPENVTVIIRSAGERTESLCKKLLMEQGVEERQLFVIREVPFSESMRVSFRTGIEQKRPWTYCVDADVLLRPNAVTSMVEIAEEQKRNVCEIQGYILDKFFGGPRPGGVHLYRTSLLPQALQLIPDEGENIRPEFHTLNRMKQQRYPWLKVPFLVGTHDDEQYYFDIYRKGFVHGVKHLNHASLFVENWKHGMTSDKDFEVALNAFSDSIKYRGDTYIDRDQDLYREMFENSGFKEKAELNISNFDSSWLEKRVRDWNESKAYQKAYPDRWGLVKEPVIPTNYSLSNIGDRIQTHGIVKTASLVTGKVISRIGKRMIRYGDS